MHSPLLTFGPKIGELVPFSISGDVTPPPPPPAPDKNEQIRCRSVSEVAGLWPDPKALRFGKQELQGEWLARLGSDNLVVALQGSAGLMVPWGRDYWERPTNISERWGPA